MQHVLHDPSPRRERLESHEAQEKGPTWAQRSAQQGGYCIPEVLKVKAPKMVEIHAQSRAEFRHVNWRKFGHSFLSFLR